MFSMLSDQFFAITLRLFYHRQLPWSMATAHLPPCCTCMDMLCLLCILSDSIIPYVPLVSMQCASDVISVFHQKKVGFPTKKMRLNRGVGGQDGARSAAAIWKFTKIAPCSRIYLPQPPQNLWASQVSVHIRTTIISTPPKATRPFGSYMPPHYWRLDPIH